jgi:hypothetical protein
VEQQPVREWLDPPNIRILVVSSSHPVTRETTTITKTIARQLPQPLYPPVDLIWQQARIQFHLASYEHVQDELVARDILSENEREFLPARLHADRSHIGGLHVYVGRNEGSDLGAGQTRSPHCSDIRVTEGGRETPSELCAAGCRLLGHAIPDPKLASS